MFPQSLSKSVTGIILSAAMHGAAFWAVGQVPHESRTPTARHRPIETLTIVEVATPPPPPLVTASEPGMDPAAQDAIQDQASDQASEAPKEPEVTPKPPPLPASMRSAVPPSALVEPVPKVKAAPAPSLPTLVGSRPSVLNAGLFQIPTSAASNRPAVAAPPKPSARESLTRGAKGGQINSRNPVLLTVLDGILRRNYPNDAHDAGIEGYARLELVVTRWGRPESIRILESHGHPAFGDACVRTVKRSRWRPAKNASGRRIAVRVRYRCSFTVGPE